MAEKQQQDRTEEATPRRRQKALQEGQTVRSVELAAALVLIGVVLMLSATSGTMLRQLGRIYEDSFLRMAEFKATPEAVGSLLQELLVDLAALLLPIAGIAALVGVSANLLQGPLVFSGKALQPKMERINPLEGIKRLVSLRSVVRLATMGLKAASVLVCGYLVLRHARDEVPLLISSTPLHVTTVVGGIAVRTLLWCGGFFVLAGAIDYLYQYYSQEKQLKMTRQEVRDENKEDEGDPHLKSKVRSIQRQRAMQRMMRDVPNSTVVITNPTHVAVAILYDAANMSAPKVLAKGKRLIALRIREIAQREGVPIIEAPPLARAIEKTIDVGHELPVHFYQAIAEILSRLYRERRLRLPEALGLHSTRQTEVTSHER